LEEKRVSLPDGILFVLDPGNRATKAPQYTPGKVSAATSTCVSIATIADVDGPVIVRFGSKPDENIDPGFLPVFEGTLQTPSRSLAVVTSTSEKVASGHVDANQASLTIYVDSIRSPSIVWLDFAPFQPST
jgi:hypothetical protein